MSADWSVLRRHLTGKPDQVTMTWRELDDLVGGMPRSAIDHTAWWAGDRPQTRAWRDAGYEVANRRPGEFVTFARSAALALRAPSVISPVAAPGNFLERESDQPGAGRVILVSCGKLKAAIPCAAADLYTSPRFRMARAYAEQSGATWFILSAEHGLVAPHEWLAPYERRLSETPMEYRRAWGLWVAARLNLLMGGLQGWTIELHAGEDYAQPLEEHLRDLGVSIERPLRGSTSGQWLSWYNERLHAEGEEERADPVMRGDATDYIERLRDENLALTAAELDGLARVALDGPGLYAWFADEQAARDLSAGLKAEVVPGLVYVGQTGGTRWPSGRPSRATLISRLKRQHLRGRRSASTLRRTMGGILDVAWGRPVTRDELTNWMAQHLRVVPVLVDDPDSLLDLERQVVQRLDPPLNLDHVKLTPMRARLSRLRRLSDAHGEQ